MTQNPADTPHVPSSTASSQSSTSNTRASNTRERFSPLHDVHVEAGASFTDFAGWQMPVRYTSDLAEHHAVRTAAGLFDLSHMAEIVVGGPEAGAYLDYALAGKMSAVAIGQAKYSLLLSPEGGIIDDLVVYRTEEERFLVVANAGNHDEALAALTERVGDFEVEVQDESDDIALIAIQGPASLEIMLEVPRFKVDEGDTAEVLGGLKYYRAVDGSFDEDPVLIARTGYTGEDGFELYIGADAAAGLWTAIMHTGASRGLVPAGLASRDTLRLEAGMPLYGHELGVDLFPAQSGLGRVVSLAKESDFVGREASEQGPPAGARVLVGLESEGKRAARADYDVYPANQGDAGQNASNDATGDAPIGRITSGALSPTLGHPIAMAFVDPAYVEPGTKVSVDIRGKRLSYTVTKLPFYSRKKN